MLISNDATAQGFTIVEAVLDGTEVAELARALETSDLDWSLGAGARDLMNHRAVSAVAVDPRLFAIARRFLGASAVPYKATLFDKSPARNWLVTWHQDTALPLWNAAIFRWGPWSIKSGITYAHAPATALSRVVALRLHFDDSREKRAAAGASWNAALGVLSDADTARLVREIPPVDCFVPSGGIVAMRPLILHASSKAEADPPRRVLHIEYVDSLDLGEACASPSRDARKGSLPAIT